MSTNLLEQFAALKTATVHFDSVHDAQVLQLKNYPIVLKGIKSWELTLDIEGKTVVYNLVGKKAKTQERDMGLINEWITRYILWDNTTVIFKMAGETLYDSRNRRSSTTKQ